MNASAPIRMGLWVLVSTLSTILATPALACSVREMTSPEDLARQADGIYHVRAARYFAGPKPASSLPPGPRPNVPSRIGFDVVATLKGPKRTRFQFPALSSADDDFNPDPVPYAMVRPDGRHGTCFAVGYRVGGEYLLLLRKGTPYWSPLAPTNEQVTGPGDKWIGWVTKQVRARRK